MKSIHELLEHALRMRASDLVLKAGAAPAVRIDGRMELVGGPVLTAEDTREFALSIIYSAGRDFMLTEMHHFTSEERDLAAADDRMKLLLQGKEVDLVF